MRFAAVVSLAVLLPLSVAMGVVGCDSDSSSSAGPVVPDASASFDSAPSETPDSATQPPIDAGADVTTKTDADADASKVVPQGLAEPVPYKSRADSPFSGLVFASYSHFEDWEDGLVNTPGVTPSSTATGSGSLCDSIDGDDGIVDGKCDKAGGCNSGFAGGTISFTFDDVALGAFPTHVGIAWTDGNLGCNAVFEAYDAADVLIGTKTAAAVGDAVNTGTVDEDRYFTVVHAAGVKRVVVSSSAGGVEVDHLHYGR
jgi:hypothetical protein